LSVRERRIDLLVEEEDMTARRTAWRPPNGVGAERGYRRLYRDQVLQAEQGCDFGFLMGRG